MNKIKFCSAKFIAAKLKHSKDRDSKFDKTQLRQGIKVEMEHTESKEIAKAIAKAHLSENRNYYTVLKEAKL